MNFYSKKDLSIPLPTGEWIFKFIPAGEFTMGSDHGLPIEAPAHKVTIEQAFFIAQFPVTQSLWQAVMGSNPSYFAKSAHHPVENVTWFQCLNFCEKFKDQFGLAARLPSEAEWEYACRANGEDEYFFGRNERELRDYAWYDMNSQDETHPVGLKSPNAWGIFDMAGNVWEWCADDWIDDYSNGPFSAAPTYLQPPSTTIKKVLRGGACNLDSYRCRSSYRSSEQADYCEKTFGFRIVLDIDMKHL